MFQKAICVRLILESRDAVIGISDDDHLALRPLLTPDVSPRDRTRSAGTRWRATVKSPSPVVYRSPVPTLGLPPSLQPSTISESAAGCEDRRRDAPRT